MGQKADLLDLLVTLPEVDTIPTRKAFIAYIEFDHVRSSLDWSGSNNAFFFRLIEEVSRQGKHSLLTFLNNLPNAPLVGIDRHNRIAALHQAIQVLDEAGWQQQFGAEVSADAQAKEQRHREREQRLQILLHDHRSFIASRMESFVGRVDELTDIRARVTRIQPQGGYVTITGNAGQGKSCIVARLVADAIAADGELAVIAHFIPFNPGPDHQVGLLRNLLARLCLKHALPELYVASDSRPALRDYFVAALRELAARGVTEIIYIDGLDQLEEDASGMRDLSFLPEHPPNGMVFVLGTRPNDTLKPLQLLKERSEYQLPPLSRDDFARVLEHRGVTLVPALADRFYAVMEANALYLDLVACELALADVLEPEQIIQQVTANPQNLFTLTFERLRRQRQQWRELLKPMLGLLLAARTSLSWRALRVLIPADAESVTEGLQRLGGLIQRDGEGRWTLYHLKLHDYLHQDPTHPEREYIFASDEEEEYHHRLAHWCDAGGGDLTMIWQDALGDALEQERRYYARQHYITHLYSAKDWEHLWCVLDDGSYGRGKVRHDPSTRSYAQDLDLGRQAAVRVEWSYEEGLALLPKLWRYSLLRCSLASKADNYPPAMFKAMVLLGREQEAIALAELITDIEDKVLILLLIGAWLATLVGQKREGLQVTLRATDVALTIKAWGARVFSLMRVVLRLAEMRQFVQAISIARTIDSTDTRVWTSARIATMLALVGEQQRATSLLSEVSILAQTLADKKKYADMWAELAIAMAQVGQIEEAITSIDTIVDDKARVKALIAIAPVLTQRGQIDEAVALAHTIVDDEARIKALIEIASVLAQEGKQKAALPLLFEATNLVRALAYDQQRAEAFVTVAKAFTQAKEHGTAVSLLIEAVQLKSVRSQDELLEALVQEKQIIEAINLARTIHHRRERAQGLAVIASTLAQLDERMIAIQLMAEASTLVQVFEDEHEFAKAVQIMAVVLVEAGREVEAIALTRTIVDDQERIKAVQAIAVALARKGQGIEAIALIRTVPDERLIEDVAVALAQAGQGIQAIALADILDNSITQHSTRWGILRALVRTGQIAETAILATSMRWYANPEIWQLITKAFMNAGQSAELIELIHAIANDRIRLIALTSLAIALTQAGESVTATPLFSEAVALVRTAPKDDYRWKELTEVGVALAQTGQKSEATSLLSEAVTLVRQSAQSSPYELTKIAVALAQAGQGTDAVALAYMVQENEWRAGEALTEVAVALAQAGQGTEAVALARIIDNQWPHRNALTKVAVALVQGGQGVDAVALARTMQDERSRWNTLTELAVALAQNGQKMEAITLLIEAVTLARTINEDEWSISEGLTKVAVALAQAGQGMDEGVMVQTVQGSWTYVETLVELLKESAITLIQAKQETAPIREPRNLPPEQRAKIVVAVAETMVQMGEHSATIQLLANIKTLLYPNDVKWFNNAADWDGGALHGVSQKLAHNGVINQLLHLVQQLWYKADTRNYLLRILPTVSGLVSSKPETGVALIEAFTWVDDFLKAN